MVVKLDRGTLYLWMAIILLGTFLLLIVFEQHKKERVVSPTFVENVQNHEDDASNAIMIQQHLQKYPKLFEDIDIKTFTLLGGIYSKDQNRIYAREQILSDADYFSFTPIKTISAGNQDYAKDRHHVYFQGEIIADADPRTFELLNNHHSRLQKYGYARDKNFVFQQTNKIEGADPETFQFIDRSLSYDGYHLFQYGKIIDNSDVRTYRFVDDNKGYYGRYAIDIFQVYYDFVPLKDIDLESFVVIGFDWALDKSHIYHRNIGINHVKTAGINALSEYFIGNEEQIYMYQNGRIKLLEVSDPETFIILNDSYAKDNKQIYYYSETHFLPLKNVDRSTFSTIKERYAKDKHNIFVGKKDHYGTISNLDVDHFQPLGGGYSKDKKNIYYQDQRLHDVDIKSFTYEMSDKAELAKRYLNIRFAFANTIYDAKDQRKCYFMGREAQCD